MQDNNVKYPVRINLFVTEEMDDTLDDMAEMMGITKHDYIRFVIGQTLASYKESVRLLQEKIK